MDREYDWQKPLAVPRHDEPEAVEKLQAAMGRVAGCFGQPPKREAGRFKLMETIQHPDTDAIILGFLADGRSTVTFDVPLRVEVFPQDSIRRRRRAYIFRIDGLVVVEAERNPYHESAPGPELLEVERVQGWPEGVRHMFVYIAQVLRASASWEQDLAENLEVLAPS